MAQDEDHVAMVQEALEGREDANSAAPPLAEYDAAVARLDTLIDVVKVGNGIAIAAAGGKPPKLKPQPRPETAAEHVLHKRKSAKHQATLRRVLGERADG